MYETAPPSNRAPLMWFVLGLVVLVIGSAYLLGSFFLYTMGSYWGNSVGELGFILMALGAMLAVGSAIFARPLRSGSPKTEPILNK